ncbi:dialkylrecorsinol condensing enzyme [Marinimicrobium sp. ARAG 43.8]|uniref:dialkylrecorsinol condensing enzyme n=1 Tax=Marinimicrobium sp. ARAG 43.8 TaxID=3418719 RepID=UPI003CE6859F
MDKPAPTARVLVVHYSQTGQLDRALESMLRPLEEDPACVVDYLRLTPVDPYPFPWPLVRFINAFPESIHDCGCPLVPDENPRHDRYDLVVLGYQVWFLSPSIPVTAFLQSDMARQLLADTPVVTLVACRNMWLQAQEKVKAHLRRLGASLVGHAALVDESGSAASFLSTPLWVLSGHKGPFWFGIPRAGVSQSDIARADRFGVALRERLRGDQLLDTGVWQGLGAVHINDKLIASEKIATRSFYVWGKLFLACGGPDAWLRKPLALIYAVFLITMILTVVPASALLKKLFAPLLRRRTARQRAYYSWPSGE